MDTTESPTAPEVTVNSTLTPIAPTQAQISYLMDLVDELAQYVTEAEAEQVREGYREMYRARTLTKSTISDEIKGMYPLIKLAKERMAAKDQEIGSEQAALVPAGRYAITGSEGHTLFVHVVKYKSGGFKVMQQIGDDEKRLPRLVARSALQKILDDGVESASMRYGRELGTCGVCGRHLTNEDSRELGIGPVCRQRLGTA